MLHHFGPAMACLDAGQDAEISVAGVHYPVKPQFVENVRQIDIEQQLTDYLKPVLAIRAGYDELVKGDDADEILRYTQGNHQLLDLPRG